MNIAEQSARLRGIRSQLDHGREQRAAAAAAGGLHEDYTLASLLHRPASPSPTVLLAEHSGSYLTGNEILGTPEKKGLL